MNGHGHIGHYAELWMSRAPRPTKQIWICTNMRATCNTGFKDAKNKWAQVVSLFLQKSKRYLIRVQIKTRKVCKIAHFREAYIKTLGSRKDHRNTWGLPMWSAQCRTIYLRVLFWCLASFCFVVPVLFKLGKNEKLRSCWKSKVWIGNVMENGSNWIHISQFG